MKTVRIANAQGFWGDRDDAALQTLLREPELDYLTLDYLAEVSLSLLALQRQRNPAAGYAQDFVQVIRSLAPYWAAGGKCRLITNAGGLDPLACAQACAQALHEEGCPELRIGVVSGDDLTDTLRSAPERHAFQNLDTGVSAARIVDRLITANAYVGADPIVQALDQGAQIVITGRVADPSLTVAACRYHFQWQPDDWNRLAGATVAGHLIECGTQVTGGIATDWLDVPDTAHLGFPIVEVSDDGGCVVTKPRGSGGWVNRRTVTEQLLYEIGDPARYLSPDVTVSFVSLQLEDLGNDRVRVRGASGAPRPDSLKVSATYRDGYRAAGTLTIVGRNAVRKGRHCGEIVLRHVQDAGHLLRDSVVECLGSGGGTDTVLQDRTPSGALETVLRIAVEADSREAVECFTKELMPLVTAGPQGTTGYAEGRPKVHPIFRYWPCLVPREEIHSIVQFVTSLAGAAGTAEKWVQLQNAILLPQRPAAAPAQATRLEFLASPPCTLYELAYARSGDKGINANVGVAARKPESFDFLCRWLTADRVQAYFRPLGVGRVERFVLPNLHALNFLLHGILSRSLRTDAQGKALGQILLEMPLEDAWHENGTQ